MTNLLQKIYDYSLEEIMSDRFARYSKTIIQDRALPDVRDGLKPVQRRILYAMYRDKNTFEKPYRKSAKTVGNVMGLYHPHGDSSIYEALVRMSQWWKQNEILIDMHGNNGSLDGDSAAAMRYTEARLSKISNELLKDIDRNTITWTLNYDDSLNEPTVLPAKYPNLLVNGSTGISAGYATNIPPHNLGEIIEATVKRIDNPNCRLDTIMDIVLGPDFPTGGIVEGLSGIKEAYQTGRGRIIIRSKIEFKSSKGKEQIIITELPYEVNKATLIKKISDIRIDKKVEGIIEERDESDKDNPMRLVIDVKKEADKDLIVNYLLKNTELQVAYNFNMVAIVNRRPLTLGILEIIDAYIKHEREIIIKRTEFDLEHALARQHIVEGLIKALSILDEVIKTIRSSKNKSDAINNLVLAYEFTEKQAEAIVLLQLYRLTNTDVTELEDEQRNLTLMISYLQSILNDEEKLKAVMKDELRKIKKEYATPRKTEIKEEITEIKIDTREMITKEDVIVIVTKDGYVKRVPLRSYKASCEEETGLKEGDYILGFYKMNTLDTLLLFTNLGNYLYIPVFEILETKWKELGKHISNIVKIEAEEKVVACLPVTDFKKEEFLTIFTKDGMVKRTSLNEFAVSRYSKPITCMKLKTKDEVIAVTNSHEDNVFVATYNGYGLWYSTEEIPVSGLKASGVKAIALKNDYVVSGLLFNDNSEYVVVITDKGTGKRIKLSEFEKTSRARRGLLLIREVKTNPHKIISVFINNHHLNLGFKYNDKINVLKTTEFPIADRYATGSSFTKNKFTEVFVIQTLNKEERQPEPTPEENVEKKEIVLKSIDDRMMTIDDFLKDLEK